MILQLFFNAIIAGSIYSLIALGFVVIYRTVRFFHFAHGGIYTIGAYLVYIFYIILSLPLTVAIIFSVIITVMLGILVEILVYKPIRKRQGSNLIFLIASLGVLTIIQNLISLIFGDDTQTIRTGEVKEGINIFGAYITLAQITIIIVSLILFIIIMFFLQKSKIGKSLRAVANNPELSKISGLDSDKIYILSFSIGSALAGIGAILVSFDTDMSPMMGFNALMMGIIAVIIGGVNSIPGAAMGGILLGLAQQFGVWKINSQWQDTIAFVILLIFLLIRPYGFMGKKLKKAEI